MDPHAYSVISLFRSIAFLNIKGNIFISILAYFDITNYLTENGYVDTSCQKVEVPGFPGCVKHSSMIWEQIQLAKHEKKDLHVVWLDLADMYGSVSHQLINYSTEFFHMPDSIRSLVSNWR